MSGVQHLLGRLINTPQDRDAIHVAVAPVVAGEQLLPGQHVHLDAAGLAMIGGKTIGVVDPFLRETVQPGKKFWIFLNPGTATVLRHDWIHPSFPVVAGQIGGPERAALELYARETGITYDELIEGANAYLKHDEYMIQGGRWEGHHFPDDFWKNFEAVTGIKPDKPYLGSFFSCSC